MPRFFHTPKWVRHWFNGLTWDKPARESVVYLTFDDGPDPVTTQWILNLLAEYQAGGTFFCVGANAQSYLELLNAIAENGHRLGNHTQHHWDGWKHSSEAYVRDVQACAEWVPGALFRPPYGKIRPAQANRLKQEGYEIVMWSILTYDFDGQLDVEEALDKCLKLVEPGAIVLFHDNAKAFDNLKVMLPRFLKKLWQAGYGFESL